MDQGPLNQHIHNAFDTMSTQLRLAARYVLDKPGDVALLSMRKQADKAGVRPATMTRLAKHLGLAGYDDVRRMYISALKDGEVTFAGNARAQVANQRIKGDGALAAEMLQSLSTQIAELASPSNLERITSAADALAAARRIYCLGLRSSHPVIWHFNYIVSLIEERSINLDAIAATGSDSLVNATSNDVILVAGVYPYTRQVVDLASYAAHLGLLVVAITDSEISPIARLSQRTITVPTESPSFLHTMAPAFIVAEILRAIIVGRGGDETLSKLHKINSHLAAVNTLFTSE